MSTMPTYARRKPTQSDLHWQPARTPWTLRADTMPHAGPLSHARKKKKPCAAANCSITLLFFFFKHAFAPSSYRAAPRPILWTL
eukprot:12881803-Prorocentrum_lima.AAC.1